MKILFFFANYMHELFQKMWRNWREKKKVIKSPPVTLQPLSFNRH